MRSASDIADWWDKQHAISKKALDSFVDEYPGLFGVVIATAAATAMELGKGTVDVLRFGEGMAEGTLGGAGKDALRAISIVGTVGKGAKIIKETIGRSRMMQLIVDPGGRAKALGGGGRCVFVSATQALRQTGQKAYAAVDDLARELGTTVDGFGSATPAMMRSFLQRVGARIGPMQNFAKWEELERAVPHDGSVLSFGVRFAKGGGHRMYAFRDAFGRVKIMDRGGTGGLPKVMDTLEDVAQRYRSAVTSITESFEIKDLFLKFIGPRELPVLAMEVLATIAGDTDTAKQMFHAYKLDEQQPLPSPTPAAPQTQQQQRHTITMPPVYITAGQPLAGGEYTVKPGDSLSSIAKRAYGDMMKFGVIYMANRRTIGRNPDVIQPGQRLRIPLLAA